MRPTPTRSRGTEAAFSLTTRLTGTVGQPLRFPTVQRCANGESYEWTDPQPGDEHPAPSLIATGAVLAPTATRAATIPVSGTGGAASLPQALGALVLFVVAATAAAVLATHRARRPAPTVPPERGASRQR
nr:DUF1775 domain-containing protein [Micromonospora tarapacensis]